jgi:hypothetical protein
MPGKRDVHVVPRGDQWAVVREGADRASSLHPTQTAAADAGRSTARREGVELVTHRPNGQIRDSDSYGGDPNPPTDRKH